ncbi:MAG: PAS domain S-box protein [Pseudomonadota bacterium]|nr:PAS domain S-box protein [Pseudomonadota bacterium]MDP1573011.1 PAS domain S-box protein [Pseudomonadota bacterium]MDP1903169.1 PAS domain S-box protein [Pseudomonadota bacterium]
MQTASLADILTFPVHTVAPDTPVSQALAQMRELRVSALVVVDERQQPLGIFTERDAVLLAYRREQPDALAVADVMSSPPMSATPELGFLSAYGLMSEHKVRHLIVVDGEGRLAGIVTEGDFIRHFGFQHLVRSRDVASVMLRALTTLPEDALVREAAHLMAKQHLDCVIVEKAGEAAGILTERDLVRMSQEGDSGLSRTLGEAMSRPVAAILPGASLGEAIRRMDELKIRRLLVTDANGQFIGLVTHHQIAAVLQPEAAPPSRVRPSAAIMAGFLGGRPRAWIFALLAALLVLFSERVIEHFAQQRALEMEKASVQGELSALRARLEGVVNANLFLVHGLAAVVAAKPDMDQSEFAGIARNLVDERHALRNIAAAPDLVISLMYPLAGNKAAIGLDYRTHPEQRQAALRARDSGLSVLAGPLRLQQGGIGIIAREPVFLAPTRPGGERRFWGLVSAVIDAETLYHKAGLRDPGMGLDLALRGSNGSGAGGPVFFGDASIFARQPVALDITLPGGTWHMAALPAAGWGQNPDTSVNLIRLMGLLAAVAAAIMAFRLARGNQALRETAARWRESQNLFEHFMANLPAGAYIRDTADDHMLFQNRWLCDNLPCRDEAGAESPTARAMAAIDQRVLIEGQLRRQESLTAANGTPLVCDTQRFLIPRADGAPLVGGIISDVSARVRAEQKLASQSARLIALLKTIPDLVWLKDPEGVYLTCNPRFEQFFGAEEADILGKSDHDFVPAELADAFREKDRAAIAVGGPSVNEEWVTFASDGHRELLETIKTPVYDDQAKLLGVLGIARNITARKQAEAALRDSEARFLATFEQAAVGIALVSPEGHWLRVNQTLCDIVGYDQAELMTRTFQDITHPDDLDSDLGQVRRMLVREIDSYSMEKRCIRKDGGIVWINLSVSLVWKGDDGPDYFISVIEDIDARKAAESALQESETRYRSLLEKAPFPAVLSRVRDGILLYGNHRAEIQYGITREQGIGQAADGFYEDPAERVRFIEQMRQAGHVEDLEVRMRGRDGRPFWALVSASIVEFDNEPAIFAAINDISARKQIEAALQEQEAFFRLIAENMGDLVAVLDLEGRRLYNSPSYGKLFGDPEALKGTDSFAEIHPDDQERVRQVFRETIATGTGQRVAFRFVLPGGDVREMESQGGVIRRVDGTVERVVVVSRDITERKRMEDEIIQLNAELEGRVRLRTAELATANKELETFTYTVSHDLKAPLRGIDGYSRLLLEDHQGQLDEEGRLFLNNVRQGVDQMGELIEDLLAYSRMERRSLNGQQLDLSRQVAAILEERRADIEARGMRVDVTLEGLSVRADPDGLAMVLRNLIDNALKFTRDSQPPKLTIRGESGDNSTRLSVADNGIGFDMRFHDRIFEIFQRLQRAEEYPGTGVGLAIVRKAMQRMGGQIRAESAPGEGATFHLELPN